MEEPFHRSRQPRFSNLKSNQTLMDEALRSVNTLIGGNISYQQIIVSIIQANVPSEFGLLKEIHALNKRLAVATDKFTTKAEMLKELKQSDVDDRILKRLYARLMEKLTRKFTVYEHHRKKLSFMVTNIRRLYRIYEQAFIPTNQRNLALLAEALKIISQQNQQLYELLLQMLVSQNYVSSIEQFNLLGLDQIVKQNDGIAVVDQNITQKEQVLQRRFIEKKKRQATHHRNGKNRITIEELFEKLKQYNKQYTKVAFEKNSTQEKETVPSRQKSRLYNDIEKIVRQSRGSNTPSNIHSLIQRQESPKHNNAQKDSQQAKRKQSLDFKRLLSTVGDLQQLVPTEHPEQSQTDKLRHKIKSTPLDKTREKLENVENYQKFETFQLVQQLPKQTKKKQKNLGQQKKQITESSFRLKNKQLNNFRQDRPGFKLRKYMQMASYHYQHRSERATLAHELIDSLKSYGINFCPVKKLSFTLDAVDQFEEFLPEKVRGVLKIKKFRQRQSENLQKLRQFPKLLLQSELNKERVPSSQFFKSSFFKKSEHQANQVKNYQGQKISQNRQNRISGWNKKPSQVGVKYDIFCTRQRRIFPKYIRRQ